MLGIKFYRSLAQLLLSVLVLLCVLLCPLQIFAQATEDPSYVIVETSSVNISKTQTATTTTNEVINSQQLSDEPVATPIPNPTTVESQTATVSGGKSLWNIVLPKPTVFVPNKKHKHETIHNSTLWSWFTGIFKK